MMTIACILAAYLIGAVPFGLLIARLYGVGDIRAHGSGNIGATNVARVAGFKAAVWVYLLDMAKGAAAVLLAMQVSEPLFARDLFLVAVVLAAILGHMFPVYLRFKGGKGVNTAFGGIIMLMPLETIVAGLVFIAVVVPSRYVSLASIVAALALPVTVIVEDLFFATRVPPAYWGLSLAVGVLVPAAHHQNIKRLLAGTESRFSFSRKSQGDNRG